MLVDWGTTENNKTVDALTDRLDRMLTAGYHERFPKKIQQLGSYEGGNRPPHYA